MPTHPITECRPANLSDLLEAGPRLFGSRRTAVEDHERRPVSYGGLRLSAHVFAAKVTALTRPGERIGLSIRSTRRAPALLLGLAASRRVPVLLDPRQSPSAQIDFCRAAGASTLITDAVGAADLAAVASGADIRTIDADAVLARVTSWDKFAALARRAWGAPRPDPGPALLLADGSTGAAHPRPLSNEELFSTARSLAARLGPPAEDGALFLAAPLASLDGLLGLILGLMTGRAVMLHPDALGAQRVPALIAASGADLLVADDLEAETLRRTAGPGEMDGITKRLSGQLIHSFP